MATVALSRRLASGYIGRSAPLKLAFRALIKVEVGMIPENPAVARAISALLIALTLAGCAVSPPEIDTSAGAEETFDGLLPVKHSRFEKAWVDPTIDLSRYTKMMGGGAEFQFTSTGMSGSVDWRVGRASRSRTA